MDTDEHHAADRGDRDPDHGDRPGAESPSDPPPPAPAFAVARVVILGAVVIGSMITFILTGAHHAPRPVIRVNPTPTVTLRVPPPVTVTVPAGTARPTIVIVPPATATATPKPTPRPTPTRPPSPSPSPSPSCRMPILGLCVGASRPPHPVRSRRG